MVDGPDPERLDPVIAGDAGAASRIGWITRWLRVASTTAVSRCRASTARCAAGKVRTNRTRNTIVKGHHTLALNSSRVKRSMNRIPVASLLSRPTVEGTFPGQVGRRPEVGQAGERPTRVPPATAGGTRAPRPGAD